jgi:hypothetical protein
VICQCGTVNFRTPTPAPLTVYHCHCNECRHQSSSAFGTSAIFPAKGILPLSPSLEEKLGVWTRPSKTRGLVIDCYFCKVCGVRIMHHDRWEDEEAKKETETKVGNGDGEEDTVCIKGGVITGLDYRGAGHIWTQEAVVDIPDGVDNFRRSPPP